MTSNVALTLSDAFKRAVESCRAGHFDQAEALCRAILRAEADHFNAQYLLAAAQSQLGRLQEALGSYEKALAIKPDYAEALYSRGLTLQHLKQLQGALASYDKALAIKPDYVEALNNRGTTLWSSRRFEEALASYDKALAIRPAYADALTNRGTALQDLKRFEEALASYDRALAIQPAYAEALNYRGNALQALRRFEEALASYDRALAIQPAYAEALYNRGNALDGLNRFEDALASYAGALAIKPDHPYAFSALADSTLMVCDWTRTAELSRELTDHVAERKSIIRPFTSLRYSGDAALQLRCARSFVQHRIPVLPQPLWSGTAYRHDRVRIAYLSADFRQHPVAALIAELIERHDRRRFEVLGISFGADDGSDMRRRLINAFDQLHDVRAHSDGNAAKLVRELEVDIAVDLMGHTRDARPEILAHRPAPIQISYLGYPGTAGAPFIDYVIADPIVLPLDRQPFYMERIIQLPECFQVNDSQRRIAERTPARREAGLPDQAFVFCCFNNSYKIRAPMFDVWMRLLRAVEDGVLWLSADNAGAQINLRKEAAARGVDPVRLLFAPRLPRLEAHLARHRLADLFLDTLPYNAHTTASDALWAGLPLITCRGEVFAGRVAASLLNAVGLPELVTTSLDEYEALALQLVGDASLLQSIRSKLAQNRLRCPLFDTERFRRHIEKAYLTAWDIWQRGESPRAFEVEAVP